MKKIIVLLFITLAFNVTAVERKIPDVIVEAIKKNARTAFPNDYTTQAYEIKTQKESFMKIVKFAWDKKVPIDVRKSIRTMAFKDFGKDKDFTTMLYVMKTQQKAYLKIN